jgi:hypothetical protein
LPFLNNLYPTTSTFPTGKSENFVKEITAKPIERICEERYFFTEFFRQDWKNLSRLHTATTFILSMGEARAVGLLKIEDSGSAYKIERTYTDYFPTPR